MAGRSGRMKLSTMSSINEFNGYNPTWCPGCGDWGIGVSIKKALADLGANPSSVFVVFGIGCSGNMNDFLNAYAIHALHGRALPMAIGMKMANHKMPVLAIVGDGDCYGEGGNHFLHACRGNHDLTVIVHDNNVYGLTTGHVAPTAQKGFKSKSTPSGILEVPVNPCSLAITQGATFVAQCFAGETLTIIEIIKKGISHKGFSLINILQPCVTFNKINTYEYYRSKIYNLPKDYDAGNRMLALEKSLEVESEKYPVGILYQISKPSFTDQMAPISKGKTLLETERFVDYDILLEDFI